MEWSKFDPRENLWLALLICTSSLFQMQVARVDLTCSSAVGSRSCSNFPGFSLFTFSRFGKVHPQVHRMSSSLHFVLNRLVLLQKSRCTRVLNEQLYTILQAPAICCSYRLGYSSYCYLPIVHHPYSPYSPCTGYRNQQNHPVPSQY